MKQGSRTTIYARKRTVISMALFAWGMATLAVCLLWSYRQQQIEQQTRRLLASTAEHAALRIEDFLEARIYSVDSLARVYARQGPADEATFSHSAAIIHQNLDGFLAINWIDPESSEIKWVYPREPNRKALGKRIDRHASAYPFFKAAIETREIQISEPLELFQGGRGFVGYFPIFRGGECIGVLNAVFRAAPMITASLRRELLDDVYVRVRDPQGLVWQSEGFPEEVSITSSPIKVWGRDWWLELAPRPQFEAVTSYSNRGELAVGLLCAFLLALLFYLFGEQQRQRIVQVQLWRENEKRLAAASKAKAVGLLARGLTHDFNNLLNVIMLNAELIEDEPDLDPEILESADAILLTAQRAKQLTNQLMAFSKPDSEEPMAGSEVAEFMGRWKGFFEGLIPADVSFTLAPVDISGQLPLPDSTMARVITNLLVNAIDALPEERERREISLSWSRATLESGQSGAALSIKDRGHGMSDEVRARIFEPYFTTKPEGEGTGLGLPTIFGIVQGARGEILVESEVGEGTTFTIVLPVLA